VSVRVVVLGAGFGGLELTSRLSEALGDDADITLIDRSDAFVFGFSKLEIMIGRQQVEAVRSPYRDLAKPGVRFRQETIVSIDPVARRTVTDVGTYDADILVVALGADLDTSATPGLDDGGNEFYSVEGATELRDVLASFDAGHVIVGVTGPSFKCPPAPSEAAILLDELFTARGVRGAVDLTLVIPFGIPIPPSPETSTALLQTFEERQIRFVPQHRVASLDPGSKTATLDDRTELPYDLFAGIPVHRAPPVVEASGLAVDGWIPVEPATLATRFPDVYAVGDVTSVGTPKAGVFAEGAGRVVAEQIIARARGEGTPDAYDGSGSCYIEFGDELVGRVDVDFLTGPSPTASFSPPSVDIHDEKTRFAQVRRQRWFGTTEPHPRKA
jgi:sulfide:quinone oxidoreductase